MKNNVFSTRNISTENMVNKDRILDAVLKVRLEAIHRNPMNTTNSINPINTINCFTLFGLLS